MSVPKPPPGFVLDAPPPPPPGFEVDEPFKPDHPGEGLPLDNAPPEPGWLEPKSMSGTAMRHFGKGGSFGLSNVASGAMGVVDEASRRAFSSKDRLPVESENLSLPAALIARYRRERDDNEGEAEAGARENPRLAPAFEITGALASPTPFGKAKVAGVGVRGLTKFGQRALVGGAAGGLSGFGESKADITKGELGRAFLDAGKGAVHGAATNLAVGKVGDAAGAGLRKLADSSALKAIGQRAGISNQLAKMGYESAGEGRQLGRAALDMGLIPKWGTAENVALNAQGMKKPMGDLIEDALSRADNVRVPLPPRPPPHVEPQQVGWDWKAMGEDTQSSATRLAAHPTRGVVVMPGAQPQLSLGVEDQSAVLAPFKPAPRLPQGPSYEIQRRPDFDEVAWRAVQNVHGPDGLSATAQRKSGPAAKLVQDILTEGKDPGASVFNLNRLKSDMYNGIDYGANSTKLGTTMQRNAVRGVREGIEAHVDRHAGSEVGDQLRTANQRYGQLSDIEKLARDESQRASGRGNSLTSLATGAGTAAAIGGPAGLAGGAGLSMISNYMRPRMPGLMAHGAAALSSAVPKAAPRAANALREADELAIQAWLDGT